MNLVVKASNIDIEYNGNQILDISELEVYSYDRIGIVGYNGVGKSTLLKIITSQIKIDSIKVQSYGKIGYIPQLEELDIKNLDNKKILGNLDVHNLNKGIISGGEETKLKIAQLLSEDADGIFLDEPTCNLDNESIKYIANSLKHYNGCVVLVSHDRYFLDEIVDKIWELKDGKIIEYWGNYTDYLNQKKLDKKISLRNYEQYISERKRLENIKNEKLKQIGRFTKKSNKRNKENGGRLAHQKSTGSKEKAFYNSIKVIEKRLEELGEVRKPIKEREINFKVNSLLEIHNQIPILSNDLNKEICGKIIFKNAKFSVPLNKKVAIIGKNGSGKTTLLKMIINKEDGIEISPKVKIGYFSQDGYKYEKENNILDFLMENSDYNISEIRNIIAMIGLDQNVINRKIGTLSGGETIKILLCKVLLGKYNVLILDEPSNYLDIRGIEALEKIIKEYKGTIIFVSHDKRLVDSVADVIYEIEDKKIIEKYKL